MRKNILITGEPKSGKSTLLEHVISDQVNKVGFITKEVRKDAVRIAFDLVSYDDRIMRLADVDAVTNCKVGKFYVQPGNIDLFLAGVPQSNEENLLYIDEIGQMQLFSSPFKDKVLAFLNSPNSCVATITSVYEDDFTKEIKARDDVIFVEITIENRMAKLAFVRALLKKIEKAKKYAQEPERVAFVDSNNATLRSDHGVRQLTCWNGRWQCECDFFYSHGVCSHVIAVETLYFESFSK